MLKNFLCNSLHVAQETPTEATRGSHVAVNEKEDEMCFGSQQMMSLNLFNRSQKKMKGTIFMGLKSRGNTLFLLLYFIYHASRRCIKAYTKGLTPHLKYIQESSNHRTSLYVHSKSLPRNSF